MPNLRLGFTEGQINDLRLGAVDFLQTILSNGTFCDFFVPFWGWWVDTHGLPVPGGTSHSSDLAELYQESRRRLISAVRYYANHPASMDGAPLVTPIIRQRLAILRRQICQYREEVEAERALTKLFEGMDLYTISDWEQRNDLYTTCDWEQYIW